MLNFDFSQRTRFISGPGAIARLGTLVKNLKAQRVLIVSDQGVVQAGLYQKGLQSLKDSDIECIGFHDLHENPTTIDVESGLRVANEFSPDLLVGLGGGSSMDCAKGINFLYSCGGKMQDYWGQGKATGDMLPMIAIPTTAGTGSEAQSYALISDAQTHVKMACGDSRAACRIAILDPELTITQPLRVTALTGIDALTHALETYVTKNRNEVSATFARSAWRNVSVHFNHVLSDGNNLEARSRMQIGACFAGMAIETSMLGAAHALANPLTARFGIPHGQAVGIMMPAVLRWNGRDAEIASRYQTLLSDLEPNPSKSTRGTTSDSLGNWNPDDKPLIDEASPPGDRLANWFTKQLKIASLKDRLRELNIERDALERLANEAASQWTAKFNPIPIDVAYMMQLYISVF